MLFTIRFPHSEISGSMAMCASPKLIAAFYVLHRFLMPRHSPFALISLTLKYLYLLCLSAVLVAYFKCIVYIRLLIYVNNYGKTFLNTLVKLIFV